jgi:hypothetical protein
MRNDVGGRISSRRKLVLSDGLPLFTELPRARVFSEILTFNIVS